MRVKIVFNIASMMTITKLIIAAHSSSVTNGHVKQILATAVSGDNISRASIRKVANLGRRPLTYGREKMTTVVTM